MSAAAWPRVDLPSRAIADRTPLLASQGHTLLTRLSGAQPSVLSAALTSHAAKPAPLSSTAQKPQGLPTTYDGAELEQDHDENEESEEDLVKRCQELMVKSDVVLFMKGDKETPRSDCFRTVDKSYRT